MSLRNLTRILDTHSMILSREISKLEDVYSLVDLVEEKLRLDVSLTLLLLESDSEAKFEKNPALNIKDEVKDVLLDDVELKRNPKSEIQFDESNEGDDDSDFQPENEKTISKTDNSEPEVQFDESVEIADDPRFEPDSVQINPKITTIKIKKTKVIKDSTGESLCNECGKIFGNKDYLRRHKRTMHESKGGCLCNECGKMYKNSRTLKKHKKAIHLKIKETYTCPICKKEGTYKYYSDFFKHKQICEAKLPENAERYSCSICGAKFGTWYNWKNHHYICSGVKPKPSFSKQTVYKCHYENCDYTNSTKIKFKNHINIVHLNLPEIRDFFCETCGKTFDENRLLQRHLVVHSDIKSVHCTICENSFKTKKHLSNHMKIHSDTRREICPFCSKGFKQKATLYRHKLSCPSRTIKN